MVKEQKLSPVIIGNRGIHIGKRRFHVTAPMLLKFCDVTAPVLFTRECIQSQNIDDIRREIPYEFGFHAEVPGTYMVEDPELFDSITVFITEDMPNVSNIINQYGNVYRLYDNVWFVIESSDPEWCISVANQIKIDTDRVLVDNPSMEHAWYLDNALNKYISF